MYAHMYTYKYTYEYVYVFLSILSFNYLVQIALTYIIQYTLTTNGAYIAFTFYVLEQILTAFFCTLIFLLD